MQGKKELSPKMLYQVHLQDLIPEHNFYRLLDKAIDFRFLYKATQDYYGQEGQESIDPVVFFIPKRPLGLYWLNFFNFKRLTRDIPGRGE